MSIETDKNNGFQIYIDFIKSDGDPSRVFHAMADLIDVLADIDEHLAGILGEKVSTQLILDDLETGSLRSWLRNVLLQIPDEAISELEIKKLIGHFLLKAKYKLVEWLGKNEEIKTIDQIKELQGELLALADETSIKQIPAYTPIDAKTLLSQLNNIQIAISRLDERDIVRYESAIGNIDISRGIAIDESLIKDILTRQTLTSEGERLVKIKKPDYLGHSRWVVRYAGHSIEAKFEDHAWLESFHKNEVNVSPGDSLRVLLYEEISYGYENEIVHTAYAIKRVIEIVSPSRFEQSQINFEP